MASIEAVTQATDALEKLRKKDADSMHAKLVPGSLRDLVAAAELALEQVKAGKLTSSAQVLVVLRMIDVIEANQRALARMLNPKAGRGPGEGMRLKPPRRGPHLPAKRRGPPPPRPE